MTLHHEGIYIAKYIYWNIGIISTTLVINKQLMEVY